MPQTTPAMREWAMAKFGGISDDAVRTWLTSEGYTLDKDWVWTAPKGSRWQSISQDHQNAIVFLIEEWDYGGCAFPET